MRWEQLCSPIEGGGMKFLKDLPDEEFWEVLKATAAAVAFVSLYLVSHMFGLI